MIAIERPEEPRTKKARPARSNVKVLHTSSKILPFFDWNGVVHHDFLPQGHAVNTEHFLNVQNYGKTNHRDCTCVFIQTQNRNYAASTVFTTLVPRWLFAFPKTEDIDKRKAFRHDWGDKRNIVTEAVGNIKKRISEVYLGLETMIV